MSKFRHAVDPDHPMLQPPPPEVLDNTARLIRVLMSLTFRQIAALSAIHGASRDFGWPLHTQALRPEFQVRWVEDIRPLELMGLIRIDGRFARAFSTDAGKEALLCLERRLFMRHYVWPGERAQDWWPN